MTRTEYIEKLDSALKAMDTRITELESKIRGAGAEGEVAFQRVLEQVKSQRDSLRTRIKQARAATDSAWSELQRGLEGAWRELEAGYERARSQLTSAGSTG